jgi:two-component system chemotaxis response regulator CheB
MRAILAELEAILRRHPKIWPDGIVVRFKELAASSLDIPSTLKVVAIGASAGGTMALKSILQELPPRSPAILIVQHMSEHFTGAFAEAWADCPIEVREAKSGDALVEGTRSRSGNRRLARATRQQYFVELSDGPLVPRHRPSVIVLFRSAARCWGRTGWASSSRA